MIPQTYCKIAGKPISKDKKGKCEYCIRPTEKKYLCEQNLKWISTCTPTGCYCGSMCSLWLLDNGFCVFHSRITYAHGYGKETRELFIVKPYFCHEFVIKLTGRTFKKISIIAKENEIFSDDSILENIAIVYNDTVKKASHMHFVLREIFHIHLLPELYPAWIWNN